jgi:hypothetical protein
LNSKKEFSSVVVADCSFFSIEKMGSEFCRNPLPLYYICPAPICSGPICVGATLIYFVAVDHVTLKIPKGQPYGFLGFNGAGKTTTIRVLTTHGFTLRRLLIIWLLQLPPMGSV